MSFGRDTEIIDKQQKNGNSNSNTYMESWYAMPRSSHMARKTPAGFATSSSESSTVTTDDDDDCEEVPTLVVVVAAAAAAVRGTDEQVSCNGRGTDP